MAVTKKPDHRIQKPVFDGLVPGERIFIGKKPVWTVEEVAGETSFFLCGYKVTALCVKMRTVESMGLMWIVCLEFEEGGFAFLDITESGKIRRIERLSGPDAWIEHHAVA